MTENKKIIGLEGKVGDVVINAVLATAFAAGTYLSATGNKLLIEEPSYVLAGIEAGISVLFGYRAWKHYKSIEESNYIEDPKEGLTDEERAAL